MPRPILDRVCDLLNHDRAQLSWITRAEVAYRVTLISPATCERVDDYRTFTVRAEAKRHAATFAPGSKARVQTFARTVQMARIVVVYPKDGAGLLRCAVSDWGRSGQDEVRHHVASASGYGYDKLTAALTGAEVGGIELGDHSDHKGRANLRDVLRREGWEAFGSIST